jgi:hypothetical protein
LLLPWLRNLSIIVGFEQPRIVEEYLTNLFRITEQCNQPEFYYDLESSWLAAVTSSSPQNKTQLELVIKFIIEKLAVEFERLSSANATTEQEEAGLGYQTSIQRLCKMIFIFVSRSNSTNAANYLVSRLLNYEQFTGAEMYIDQLLKSSSPRSTIASYSERAAFNLLVNFSFENGLSLVSHVAIILQNAIVLYGPSRKPKYPEGVELVINLILSLGYQHAAEEDIRTRSLQLVKNIKSKRFNVYGEYVKVDYTPEEILQIIEIIGHHQ